MKRRDIVMGLIIVLVFIAGVIFVLTNKKKVNNLLPSPTPSITQRVNNTFPGLNIPESNNNIELKDVSGGNAFGVATPTEIVANLAAPTGNQVYQGWLQNPAGKKILLGSFRVAKSGYILSYDQTKYTGYNTVLVTLGGKTILQGSF